MERLKELNIMPTFGMDIEAAVRTNLQAYQYYNPYMYNKKLGGTFRPIFYCTCKYCNIDNPENSF